MSTPPAHAHGRKHWHVVSSTMAARIENPIRELSSKADTVVRADDRPLLKLSMGDPTIDKGFFELPRAHHQALHDALDSNDYNGYAPASGLSSAREAVASFWKKNFVTPHVDGGGGASDKDEDEVQRVYERKLASIQREHVVLTSGGSHAIMLAITAIAGAGDNVLLPIPCFPHYITICDTFHIKKKFYKLDPKNNWEVTLKHVRQQCDQKTKLLVITNPSNPCGSNFSRHHVRAILKTAEELKLPVFSDEIYAGMVYQSEAAPQKEAAHSDPNAPAALVQRKRFTSVADIDTCVPRVILGGTAKQFAVPGWRVGWLIYVGDTTGSSAADSEAAVIPDGQRYAATTGQNYLYGIEQQALLIIGPSSLAQAALPAFLTDYSLSMLPPPPPAAEGGSAESQAEKDAAFFYRYVTKIEHCARTFVTALNEKCVVPTGAAAGAAAEEEGGARKEKKGPLHMLHAHMPQAAMYVMVKINLRHFDPAVVKDDYTFFENLLREEGVQLIPGSAFRQPGFLRVVITRPEDILLEAVDRIAAFCQRHYSRENEEAYAAAARVRKAAAHASPRGADDAKSASKKSRRSRRSAGTAAAATADTTADGAAVDTEAAAAAASKKKKKATANAHDESATAERSNEVKPKKKRSSKTREDKTHGTSPAAESGDAPTAAVEAAPESSADTHDAQPTTTAAPADGEKVSPPPPAEEQETTAPNDGGSPLLTEEASEIVAVDSTSAA